METRRLKRTEVEGVVSRALLATGVVEKVYTHGMLAGNPPEGDPDFPLYRRSFFAPRSPHLLGHLRKYVYLGKRPAGTGHGTPQDYDRHVPIVFLGPGVTAGERAEPCGPQDIAPTLAQLLHLDYPEQDGRRLRLDAPP